LLRVTQDCGADPQDAPPSVCCHGDAYRACCAPLNRR
jgi:hypothetical protein